MRIFIAIILLAAAIALLFFWANPLWKNIQKLQAEKAAYESVIARINTLRKARDELLSSYNAIPETELKRIKKILPDTAAAGSLLVQLSNMTNESALLLKNIDVSETSENEGVVSLNLSLSGNYENFIAFLKNLEKSLRLIDVASISFSISGDRDFYDFSLSAKSYMQEIK